MEDSVRDTTVFTRNGGRLLEGDVTGAMLHELLMPDTRRICSAMNIARWTGPLRLGHGREASSAGTPVEAREGDRKGLPDEPIDHGPLAFLAFLAETYVNAKSLAFIATPVPRASRGGVMGAGLLGALHSSGSPIWPLVGATIIILLTPGCRPIGPPAPSPTSAGVASVAQETDGPTESPLAFPDHWRLEFSRSGGIAGEMKTITVTDDGSFVATGRGLQESLEGTLSKEEVGEVGGLLAEVYPFRSIPRGSECRDCFLYTIRLDLGGRLTEITLDDVTLPNSGLEQLVATLNSVLERELLRG